LISAKRQKKGKRRKKEKKRKRKREGEGGETIIDETHSHHQQQLSNERIKRLASGLLANLRLPARGRRKQPVSQGSKQTALGAGVPLLSALDPQQATLLGSSTRLPGPSLSVKLAGAKLYVKRSQEISYAYHKIRHANII
jgi:hypothetical protein